MNLLSKLKHKYLSDLLLYSFLGCISYFILIKFSNVSIRLNEGVMQMQVFIAFLFLFNGVGMSIRYATERMKARSSSPQKSRRWFILFLDIQLTDGNSFLFIEKARPQCAIVFTTAFDEYAVQAFTVNSIDYLLKPIHKERLEESIARFEKYHARRIFSSEDNQAYLENILSAIGQTGTFRKYRQRFLITSPRRVYTISIPEIAYFYSEDKISFAVTFDGKTHILDLTLNKLEEQLDPELFFRANRQVLLSADCIEQIEPHFNGKMLLQLRPKAKEQILVSREKVSALKMWLNK